MKVFRPEQIWWMACNKCTGRSADKLLRKKIPNTNWFNTGSEKRFNTGSTEWSRNRIRMKQSYASVTHMAWEKQNTYGMNVQSTTSRLMKFNIALSKRPELNDCNVEVLLFTLEVMNDVITSITFHWHLRSASNIYVRVCVCMFVCVCLCVCVCSNCD